ncbi:hypothetical protein Q9L58_008626 [Maublancomyces gigas]|uniref:Kinetochore protein Sos7 coiled-coil domain-containing protein n=1 Tax=Discina gigas TaxID=1032678 RepID=A0ABR3G991_9PEZI
MRTTTANPDYTALLATLAKVQQHDFAILRLSESISPAGSRGDLTYNSDASSIFNSSPSALQADLLHYKELFSKLRFSYLEQVTKEKFLRAITEDPPLVIEPAENTELELKLAAVKIELRRSKADVDTALVELEILARRVAPAYAAVGKNAEMARRLPGEVEVLEKRIRDAGVEGMALRETTTEVMRGEQELRVLERELDQVGREAGRKRKEKEKVEGEVRALEGVRAGLERFVGEAVRMRYEARAGGDTEREAMGRWYKSVFEGLEALLPEGAAVGLG